MKHLRKSSGQVMTEYTITLVVMVTVLFLNVDGTPLYLQLANAVKSSYQSFAAAISIPVTPL